MGEQETEPVAGVRLTLLCDVEDASGRSAQLPVRLRHSPDDPLAVSLELGEPESCVRWVFSVDLLREGVERLAGAGRVRVWPSAVMQDRPEVSLRLESGEKSATIRLPGSALQLFLMSIAVCLDDGQVDLLVDAELERLFGGRQV